METQAQPQSTRGNALYMSTLTRRILKHIDERRTAKGCGKASGLTGFNLRKLSRDSGIPYWTLYRYVSTRNRKLSLTAIDNILYGLGMSVMDFLMPMEIAQRLAEYTPKQRDNIKRVASGRKKTGGSGKPRSAASTTSTQNSTPDDANSVDIDPDSL